MRRVIIESPFAGNFFQRWRNRRYARKCMLDSLSRGEAPFASHLLYTQVLDDSHPADRSLGILVGLLWGRQADATVVYIDRGISEGMKKGMGAAHAAGRPIEFRRLKPIPSKET